MKVLQLIDSLHPGGAERMAVTIANALVSEKVGSYLCATREEGLLKQNLKIGVGYFYLKKKSALDIVALLRLRRKIRQHQITIVHAHTTSYFFATLLKISCPSLKLIWHEHQGDRIATTRRENLVLYFCSFFFTSIIVVNQVLQRWCEKNLLSEKVIYLPNFVLTENLYSRLNTEKNIVCVANLRSPKNHNLLLKAFAIVHSTHPDWKLHLLGRDFEDSYSADLKTIALKEDMNESIIFWGSSDMVESVISTSAIGVLSSNSEGLPMALLEYGRAGLAVVCTDVGQCREVVGPFGKIVPPKNEDALAEALLFYIENEGERVTDAEGFSKHITANYSGKNIMPKLLAIYKNEVS